MSRVKERIRRRKADRLMVFVAADLVGAQE
jgi:hypothetical protein